MEEEMPRLMHSSPFATGEQKKRILRDDGTIVGGASETGRSETTVENLAAVSKEAPGFASLRQASGGTDSENSAEFFLEESNGTDDLVISKETEKKDKHKERKTKTETSGGVIREPKNLYGREDEVRQLGEIYHRVSGGHTDSPHMVVITGEEGIGKSSLAYTLYDEVMESGGFWMEWRGEEILDLKAGNGLEDAFTGLCKQIMQRDEETKRQIREKVLEMGSLRVTLLLELIWELKPLLKGYFTPQKEVKTLESSGIRVAAIRDFFARLTSFGKPMVYFIDNIHLAHPNSVSIFSKILPHANVQNTLYLATIASYENDAVNKMLMLFKDKIGVTRIDLPRLEDSATCAMIADMLRVNLDACQPLADYLHRQTDGNPLFVSELVRFMYEVHAMTFDEQEKSWKIHDERMGLIRECTDLDRLMEYRLRGLSESLKECMTTAACFGSRISVKMIGSLVSRCSGEMFEIAAGLRLVEQIHVKDGQIYHFTHSSVRKSALNLLSEPERASFHVSLGRKLWREMVKKKDTKKVNDVLCQLKLGFSKVTNSKERHEAALLCVDAAEWQLQWVGAGFFNLTMDCLEFGIVLLGTDGWKCHYDLNLRIHNVCAELAFTNGCHERALELVDIVIRNAAHFEDKIQAFCTKLLVLSASQDFPRLIVEALDVFEQLGEPIPADATRRYVRREYHMTRKLLNSMSSEQLLGLPVMYDTRKTAVLQAFNLAYCAFFILRPNVASVMVMRATRLCLNHGLSAVSAFVFGLYGWFECSRGNIEEGTRFGNVSLELLERFEAKQWIPRCYASIHGRIGSYTKGLRAAYGHLRHSQTVASETGDTTGSMMCGFVRCHYLFRSGEPLKMVQSEIKTNFCDCHEGLDTLQLVVGALEEIVGVLQTDDENPRLLSRDDNDVAECEGGAENCTMGKRKRSLFVDGWRSVEMGIFAFLFGDYDLAWEDFETARKLDLFDMNSGDIALMYVMDGLIAISHFRMTGKNKRQALRIARSRVHQLKFLAQYNPRYCNGKVALLQAEIESITSDYRHAHVLYVAACSIYAGERMLMEHAIALELAGLHMRRHQKDDIAREHLEEAVGVFREWGAQGKANKLEKQIDGELGA